MPGLLTVGTCAFTLSIHQVGNVGHAEVYGYPVLFLDKCCCLINTAFARPSYGLPLRHSLLPQSLTSEEVDRERRMRECFIDFLMGVLELDPRKRCGFAQMQCRKLTTAHAGGCHVQEHNSPPFNIIIWVRP